MMLSGRSVCFAREGAASAAAGAGAAARQTSSCVALEGAASGDVGAGAAAGSCVAREGAASGAVGAAAEQDHGLCRLGCRPRTGWPSGFRMQNHYPREPQMQATVLLPRKVWLQC